MGGLYFSNKLYSGSKIDSVLLREKNTALIVGDMQVLRVVELLFQTGDHDGNVRSAWSLFVNDND
jgi:hypothetical protein